MILGTYRDVELDVQKPFEKTLARLVRQKLAERYAIKRLAEPDVRDLLAALGGSDPPVVLVSAIYRETEGNPFFVTEVFQHLSEEGALFDDDGQWKSELDVEALDVPEGVRLVIGRRLEVRVLEAVEGQDPNGVLDALDEAIAAGLVTSITVGREARYAFAHELIRQTLLATLSLPRRQRLHLRVANAFEKVYEARADERAADVARHLYQAGTAAESTKTIHYHYYFDVFRSNDLVRAGEEAIALHRELGGSWALSHCLAATRIGWLTSGQFDKIDGSAEELLTLSTRQGDLGSQMLFSMVQAPREAARGDLDAFETFIQRSVDLALAADWPWSQWNLASNAFAHVFRGRAEDAKQVFDRAEPERLRGTVWDGTYDGLKLLAFAYLEEPEAMAVFEASRDRLPKLGQENPGGSLLFLTMAIEALTHLGQRDQAAALYPLTKELVEGGAMVLLAPGAPLVEKCVAIGAMAAERWDEAESRFETALSQAEKLSHRLEQPEVRRWYARMLLERDASGDREKARELLGAALSAYKGLGMPRYVAMVEALL